MEISLLSVFFCLCDVCVHVFDGVILCGCVCVWKCVVTIYRKMASCEMDNGIGQYNNLFCHTMHNYMYVDRCILCRRVFFCTRYFLLLIDFVKT